MKKLLSVIVMFFNINTNAQVCFTTVNYKIAMNILQTISSADMNNDGKPDIIISENITNVSYIKIFILYNDGFGNFNSSDTIFCNLPDLNAIRSFNVSDFNEDGNMDIAISVRNGLDINYNYIKILYGDGAGNFPVFDIIPVSYEPYIIYTNDFNGDTHSDIILVHGDSCNHISVLLGNGTGHFNTSAELYSGHDVNSITSGDFNGDEKRDLAVSCSGNGGGPDSVWVYLGNGDGTFGTASEYLAGSAPSSVCSKDFNGDGFDDLAVANSNSNNVSVFISKGNSGTFYNGINYIAGLNTYIGPSSVISDDFNLDSIPDLAVGIFDVGIVYILLGAGDGTFNASSYFIADYQTSSVISADFNADGKPDLATVNDANDDVSILLNCDSVGIAANTYKQNTSVYPNPTTGTFTIETNLREKLLIQIFDLTGKLVLSKYAVPNESVDASGLREGVYNLVIENKAGIMNKKLVVIKEY